MSELELVVVTECLHKRCKGNVVLTKKEGRFYPYRGVFMELPAELLLPRCIDCGTEWLSEKHQSDVEALLIEMYKLHADDVDKAVARFQHGTPKYKWWS